MPGCTAGDFRTDCHPLAVGLSTDPDGYDGCLAALGRNRRYIDLGAASLGSVALDDLIKTEDRQEIHTSMEGVGPDMVAKIMFTSRSAGKQKGVITNHRIVCSNMSASVRPWPFMSDHPTVLLDWLPWS